jgi:hypothetical protein
VGTDPLALLEAAIEAVEELPDDAVCQWLSAGLQALAEGDDPRPAMGLAPIDRCRLRRATRDRWLRRACRLVEASSAWGRCRELEREIGVFISIVWPRWCKQLDPPAGCSELRAALFRARQHGELPSTARQLRNICGDTG